MVKTLNIHSKTIAYQGFFKIELVDYQHSLYQGGMSSEIRRELFNRGQAVVVLLYDLVKQCVVLIEQCRAGALDQAINSQDDHQAWLIEPVAGMIDEGETPQKACEREVFEEAGIVLNDFEYLTQFYPSPGGSSEILHLYAAQLDSDQVAEFSGLAHEVEDIRIIKLPFAQAKQALLNGEFNVASTIIGLQWLFFQRLAS